MPAVSQAQQRVMAIAKHHPEKLHKKNRGILSMSSTTIGEFARTKRKGLPKKKRRR
jgi:hypothetical protein